MTKEQRIDNETGRYREQYCIAKHNNKYCIIEYTNYDYPDSGCCDVDVKRAFVHYLNGETTSLDYSKLEMVKIDPSNIRELSACIELKKVLDTSLLRDRLRIISATITDNCKERSMIESELRKLNGKTKVGRIINENK